MLELVVIKGCHSVSVHHIDNKLFEGTGEPPAHSKNFPINHILHVFQWNAFLFVCIGSLIVPLEASPQLSGACLVNGIEKVSPISAGPKRKGNAKVERNENGCSTDGDPKGFVFFKIKLVIDEVPRRR